MKKLYVFFVVMGLAVSAFAQSGTPFNFQMVVRDNSGIQVINQAVSFKLYILKGSPVGSVIYSEKHDTITSDLGLVTLSVGAGIDRVGKFDSIDWSDASYYLRTTIKLSGASAYTEIGTSQFKYVPYAMYAKKSGSGTGVTSVTGTAPVISSGGTAPIISIADAAADGGTKGASTYTATDFNATTGVISLDYSNGQKANGSVSGFLSSADWNTFTTLRLPTTGGTMTGKLNTVGSAAGNAGLNLPHGIAPSSPGNGDIWTTTGGLFIRINGSTIGPLSSTTGTVTSVTGTTPVASTGGTTPAISILDAIADGSTKGASTFTAADFNTSTGIVSLDYSNGQKANGSVSGFLSSTDWNTFTTLRLPTTGGTMTGKLNTVGSTAGNAGLNLPHGIAPTSPGNGDMWTTTGGLFVRVNNTTVGPLSSTTGTVTSVTGTLPVSSSGGTTPVISIADAAADGSTKGASAFTSSDFDAATGIVSLDYTNGQKANGSLPGFLSSTDWNTFTTLRLPTTGGTMTGKLNTVGSTAGNAGLNLPHGIAPAAPVNGDLWTTSAGLFVRANNTTTGPLLQSGLTSSHIFVGNVSNAATDVAMTGDATMSNTGALTLSASGVTAGSYGGSSGASVPYLTVDSKGRLTSANSRNLNLGDINALTATLSSSHIFVGNASNVATDVSMSGDAGLSSSGTLTLSPSGVNAGSYGSGSGPSVPYFSVDSKGRLTVANSRNLACSDFGALPIAGGTMTGKLTTVASSSGNSGVSLPHGTAPSSPVNGDLWTTTSGLFARINNSTYGPLLSSSLVSAHIFVGNSSGTATDVIMSGDASISNTGTLALSTSGVASGSYGGSSGASVPYFTVDSKGRLTSANSRSLNCSDISALPTAGGTMTGPFNSSSTIDISSSVSSTSDAVIKSTNTNTNGVGIIGIGGGSSGGSVSGGAGGGFFGKIYGLYAVATVSSNGNYGGFFSCGTAQSYLGGKTSGGTDYKVTGTGVAGTIVENQHGKQVMMFCPESPDILFTDYGVDRLIAGHSHITLDPVFSKNIIVNEECPMKVFVQLEGECNGVYVTNKTKEGFDVYELNHGSSNVSFSWSVVATRDDRKDNNGVILSKHVGVRFPVAPTPPVGLESSGNK